jgi:hypothetical protein
LVTQDSYFFSGHPKQLYWLVVVVGRRGWSSWLVVVVVVDPPPDLTVLAGRLRPREITTITIGKRLI